MGDCFARLDRSREPFSIPTLSLGAGESEAIALALERPGINLLIDDRKGELAARELGIGTVGTLALLELADEAGLIDFEEAGRRLRATSFYFAEAIFAKLLERAQRRHRNAE